MDQHPYSPDLAPYKLFLFSTVKNKQRGQQDSTPEEFYAFKNHVLEIPQTE